MGHRALYGWLAMVGLAYPRWLERQGPLAGWRRVGWATQESGGGPQGEGPGSLKGQGLWHSEIRNEAVPPRIANAAYSRSGFAVGQQPGG